MPLNINEPIPNSKDSRPELTQIFLTYYCSHILTFGFSDPLPPLFSTSASRVNILAQISDFPLPIGILHCKEKKPSSPLSWRGESLRQVRVYANPCKRNDLCITRFWSVFSSWKFKKTKNNDFNFLHSFAATSSSLTPPPLYLKMKSLSIWDEGWQR